MDAPRTVLVLYQTLLIVTYGQDSCIWGKYGENCSKDCPSNCIDNPVRNIRHCHKETGKCSEGCVPGWFEDLCDHACSKNCLRNICNRQKGICAFGCSGSYTGDYCNIGRVDASTKGSIDSTTNGPIDTTTTQHTILAAIRVPVVIVIIIFILAVVLRKLRRNKSRRKRKGGRSDNRYQQYVTPVQCTHVSAGANDARQYAVVDEAAMYDVLTAGGQPASDGYEELRSVHRSDISRDLAHAYTTEPRTTSV